MVDFDDQRRGRLNLIRHLLDQMPDYHAPGAPIEFPPLSGKPAREHFTGPVRPIRNRF